MLYIKILAAITVLFSIAWLIVEPRFESALAVFGSISALIYAFLVRKRTTQNPQQHQSVSNTSVGVQAGKDVSIGNLGDKKDAK